MVVIGLTAIGWGVALDVGSSDESFGRVFTAAGAINTAAIGWCWLRPQNAAWWIRWIVQPVSTLVLTLVGYFFAEVMQEDASQRVADQFGISLGALITIAFARVALATAVNDMDKKRNEEMTQQLQALTTARDAQTKDLDGIRKDIHQLQRGRHDVAPAGLARLRRAIAVRLLGS